MENPSKHEIIDKKNKSQIELTSILFLFMKPFDK